MSGISTCPFDPKQEKNFWENFLKKNPKYDVKTSVFTPKNEKNVSTCPFNPKEEKIKWMQYTIIRDKEQREKENNLEFKLLKIRNQNI
jgi:hypothetical protein